MIDHVTVGVSDCRRSRTFYDRTLSVVGIECLHAETQTFAGYGTGGKAIFWIGQKIVPIAGVHVAFAVTDRAAVDRFHAAGLTEGGRDNGPPGLRPQYHPDYYGAFVLDPDGRNIEAVCRLPA